MLFCRLAWWGYSRRKQRADPSLSRPGTCPGLLPAQDEHIRSYRCDLYLRRRSARGPCFSVCPWEVAGPTCPGAGLHCIALAGRYPWPLHTEVWVWRLLRRSSSRGQSPRSTSPLSAANGGWTARPPHSRSSADPLHRQGNRGPHDRVLCRPHKALQKRQGSG